MKNDSPREEIAERSYVVVTTVEEAVARARELRGDYQYVAGGTDLEVHRRQELVAEHHVIDLTAIKELHAISIDGEELSIGALVTLDEIISDVVVRERVPLLATAARSVATPVIRKSATVGGNLLVKNRCTFYDQSGSWRSSIGSCLRDNGDICQVVGTDAGCYSRNVSDMAAAFIALGATIVVRDQKGEKRYDLTALYSGDGIRNHNLLENDGIILRVQVPIKPVASWYRKLRLRESLDFTSCTVAAAVDERNYIRVCINGVSMAPVLIEGDLAELSLEELHRRARRSCQTVDNDLLPLKYRREMIHIYLEEWWGSIHVDA